MKKNYKVTINGVTHTRNSHRDYAFAGEWVSRKTGKGNGQVTYYGPGIEVKPRWKMDEKEWKFISSEVEIVTKAKHVAKAKDFIPTRRSVKDDKKPVKKVSKTQQIMDEYNVDKLSAEKIMRAKTSKAALEAVTDIFAKKGLSDLQANQAGKNLKGVIQALHGKIEVQGGLFNIAKQRRAVIREAVIKACGHRFSGRYIIETLSRVFREIELRDNPVKVLSKPASKRQNTGAVQLVKTFQSKHKDISLAEMAKLFRAASTLAAKMAQEEDALANSEIHPRYRLQSDRETHKVAATTKAA